MDIIINPLEELFASLSVLLNFLNLFVPTACSDWVCGLITVVGAIVLFVLFAGLWLFGKPIIIRLYPLAGAVTAYLYAQVIFVHENGFLRFIYSLLIIAVFLAISELFNRYRGTFIFVILGIIAGQFIAASTKQEAFVGAVIGAFLAMLLSILPGIRKQTETLFDRIAILVTVLVGGTVMTVVVIGLVVWLISLTPFTPFGYETNIFSLLFAFAGIGLAFRAWLYIVGFGILFQKEGGLKGLAKEAGETKEELSAEEVIEVLKEASPKKKTPLAFLIDLGLASTLTVYVLFSASTLKLENVNQLPVLETVKDLGPVATWLDYQKFTAQAVRPWYNYPWENLSPRLLEYSVVEGGADAYSCPRLSCEVSLNLEAGFLTKTNPIDWEENENTVGYIGITDDMNVLRQVEGEDVDGSNRWYLLLTRDFKLLYVPEAALETQSVAREDTDLPIVNITLTFALLFAIFIFGARS
jgi:hypothetical protein